MTIPVLLFGFLISTLMGGAFHLWKGGSFWRLLLYIAFAWAGFWGGHWLGNSFGLTFGSIGPLRLGMALIVGALTLYAGHWLSQFNQEESRS